MIDYKIYYAVNELPGSWDELSSQDIFLKTSFLRGLEDAIPNNITPFYLGVFKAEKLVGIAIIQRVEMYLDDVFRRTSRNTFKQFAKRLISKIVKGNALVVGNLMHTGQHGLFYIQDEISQDNYLNTIARALKDLSEQIKNKYNKKVRIIAYKDYFEDDSIHNSSAFFKAQNLYKAKVQPNMIFSISDAWKTPQDYISAFNKKYRNRYKTARKKSNILECRELALGFLEENSKSVFELYEAVSDNARVNSFKLPENHFLSLKQSLQDDFKVFGFFLNNQLVGFYSLILNNDTLETYFLGYNKAFQHQMYLNMLFNMASFGIQNGFKTIVYARTAMEIKSSIGAKPHTMHIYLKHTNNFIANTVLKCIVKYMNPIQKWEERHPFKN
ncbi:MAG: GNAT family N-acetyltransferase [Flavobacteriaceae bacterium]